MILSAEVAQPGRGRRGRSAHRYQLFLELLTLTVHKSANVGGGGGGSSPAPSNWTKLKALIKSGARSRALSLRSACNKESVSRAWAHVTAVSGPNGAALAVSTGTWRTEREVGISDCARPGILIVAPAI
ncbi:hypothetical protein EVAR_4752_1 [Eumeta japonica]|uniref:Uncharacterized protein n=1 Tax=Eumeta variegata TaxID=151549 RepID=A0A4C1T1E9_EUMVA|nr:hypothetical protein EVAR_4752_1 [Eumeta japonica]